MWQRRRKALLEMLISNFLMTRQKRCISESSRRKERVKELSEEMGLEGVNLQDSRAPLVEGLAAVAVVEEGWGTLMLLKIKVKDTKVSKDYILGNNNLILIQVDMPTRVNS